MHSPLLLFLILTVSAWLARRQQMVIEYLLEENRVLREQLSRKRMRRKRTANTALTVAQAAA